MGISSENTKIDANQPNKPDVDLFRVSALGNQLIEQLSALRVHDPVYWSEAQKTWIITGHAEVSEGFKRDIPFSVNRFPRLFSYFPESECEKIPNIMELFPKFLINIDPPEQQRLRKLMMKAFSRNIAESFRPQACEIIDQTLSTALKKRVVEFVGEVAMQIPARVILRMMGLSDDYYPKVRAWGISVTRGFGAGGATADHVLRAEEAFGEMRQVFQAEIDKRRKNPVGDFISELVVAEDGGQQLTDADIIATCMLTIIAGHDTTANTITLAAECLARKPDVIEYIRSNNDAIDNIMMELMRYIAMSATQFRVVARDFEWRGKHFKKGQSVWLAIAAANRDPTVFTSPDTLDFGRSQNPNLTFAPGIHLCIGHYVARMQLGEFFKRFANRVEHLEVLDEQVEWDSPLTFRGLRHLNVRLVPREIEF